MVRKENFETLGRINFLKKIKSIEFLHFRNSNLDVRSIEKFIISFFSQFSSVFLQMQNFLTILFLLFPQEEEKPDKIQIFCLSEDIFERKRSKFFLSFLDCNYGNQLFLVIAFEYLPCNFSQFTSRIFLFSNR